MKILEFVIINILKNSNLLQNDSNSLQRFIAAIPMSGP